MKKSLLFSLALLGAAVALGSCGGKGKDPVPSPGISVSPETQSVPVEGTTFSVAVRSSAPWTMSVAGNWVTGTMSGNTAGDGSATFVVAANASADVRSLKVVFTAGVAKDTLLITQPGAPVNFDVKFDPPSPATVPNQQNTTITAQLTANASWSAAAADPSWVSITPSTGTGDARLSITAYANTGLARSNTVTIKCGDRQVQYTVNQIAAAANSYIVAPGATLSFPVSQANADGVTRIADGDVVVPLFLWGDRGGQGPNGVVNTIVMEGDGATRCIKITAGTVQGNAVIAAQVGGATKWSWHIWVTPFDPVATGQSYSGTEWGVGKPYYGKVMMDRNLGALGSTPSTANTLAMGLLYQWGRKDPFPGHIQDWSAGTTEPAIYNADGSTSAAIIQHIGILSDNNLEFSIAHPATFLIATGTAIDWYTSSGAQRDDLWGKGVAKSAYDPCPPGWMVPQNVVWRDFSGAGNAFKDTGAAGYRSIYVLPADAAGGLNGLNGPGVYYSAADKTAQDWKYKIYYPSTGYRWESDGAFYSVADLSVRCWSSMVATSGTAIGSPLEFIGYLSAGVPTISFATTTNKARGVAVRCVSQ